MSLGVQQRAPRAAARRAWIATAVAVAAAVLAAIAVALTHDDADRAFADPSRPNVVFLMTDDQDVGSMSAMLKTRRLLGDEGVTFANSIAAWPLCCPSRATFQTGLHAHNHGVLENKPPTGGFESFDPESALPVWLQEAGYRTAHIGEYLNGYKKFDGIPAGWDEWQGLGEPSNRYFKPRMNENGEIRRHANVDDDGNYSTDLFTTKAVRFIESQTGDKPPFFLSVGYVAPHGGPAMRTTGRCAEGPEPAPRHVGELDGEPLPQSPSFDEADVSDKPAPVREHDPLTAEDVRERTAKYRCRLETLLAVDESVAAIVDALRDTGELDDTYIFFTSDNGYLQGQHRIRGGKSVLYEESLRVPLLVRGPGIAAGEVSHDLISNVDWAPTILDIAGARADGPRDGVSLLPVARQPGERRGRALLIESAREGYEGVRTDRFVYAEYLGVAGYDKDDVEMYDLRRDPYELQNVAGDPGYEAERAELRRLLGRLRGCEGQSCEARPEVLLAAERGEAGAKRSCPSGVVRLSLRGPDAGIVVEAEAELGDGSTETFEGEAAKVEVAPGEAAWVRARIETIDGRIADLRTRIPSCDEPG